MGYPHIIHLHPQQIDKYVLLVHMVYNSGHTHAGGIQWHSSKHELNKWVIQYHIESSVCM